SYSQRITEQLRTVYNKQACCVPFGYDNYTTATKQNSKAFDEKFLFIGAYDRQRAAWLDQLKEDDLDIYGNSKWKSRNIFRPRVARAYRQRSLYGDDYTTAIQSAKGIINLLRDQNMLEASHNMRTFEVPGYGGLLISQRTDEQLQFFEED